MCPGGDPPETLCDDGVDNDCNGAVDCVDAACTGQPCVDPLGNSGCCAPGGLCTAAACTDGGVGDGGWGDGGPMDAGPPDAGPGGGLDARPPPGG